jgi:signal-transduction protein with cAMP-binding, CBS, and nucleotidyltransferase domain
MALSALTHHPLVTVDHTATIAEVARLMDDCGAHLVVVTDGKRLAGVVTERDIVIRGVAHRYPPDARVEAVMSTEVASLSVDADRGEAIAAFRDLHVRHLPLIDGSAVVAVLAADDLVDDTDEESGAGIPVVTRRATRRPA